MEVKIKGLVDAALAAAAPDGPAPALPPGLAERLQVGRGGAEGDGGGFTLSPSFCVSFSVRALTHLASPLSRSSGARARARACWR